MALAGASRDKADAYLELQMHEMRERNPYERSHLRLRRFSDWAKAALEFSIGLIALAVVSALGVMVWKAAHSEGYVIESFAVPSQMAEQGLTGEVVASRLLDRMTVVMTPPPNSVSNASSLSISASDDVKVEIPQTGISLGELYRFLRRWLGKEVHISGEVVRQDGNVSVAVRVNGKDGALYQGPEADFDALIQKAAEHVFDIVGGTRYAGWLYAQNPRREAEARAAYQRLLNNPATSSRNQASAWNGFGNMANGSGEYRQAQSFYRRGRETDPSVSLIFSNANNNAAILSRPEAALALVPQGLAAMEKDRDSYSPDAFASVRARLQGRGLMLRGDYAGAVAELQPALRFAYQPYNTALLAATSRAQLHDGAATAWLADQPVSANVALNPVPSFITKLQIEAALQHWPRVIALAAQADKVMTQAKFSAAGREVTESVQIRPWVALAKAMLGDIAGAQTLIAATPADCNDCLRIRGMIASEAKQWDRADFWFAKAVSDAPSIPFAHENWGLSLLARGQADAAVAQFTLANQKGPKFADALEGWGEALMTQNQSHLALAKFQQAAQYAPNWGRLHLKWGQALTYAGKPEDAKAHFARAATLDLTPSEKAELARQS
jgi:tetratricopeptide (TPR) repeat protein